MQKQIEISGIVIIIEKKNIRNMYLRVLPPEGTVKITAPKRISEEKIIAFVTTRLSWIKAAQEKVRSQPRQSELQYLSGETHYLWGKPYCLEVIYSDDKAKVYLADNKIILQIKADSALEQREKLMEEWYRAQLKQVIPSVLEKCIRIVGQRPDECRVKNMKTRWGTCNIAKRRIWLNLQLVKRAPECLEYVMIHELVHFYCRNHDTQFYAYMDEFCPDWRLLKKRLNQGF